MADILYPLSSPISCILQKGWNSKLVPKSPDTKKLDGGYKEDCDVDKNPDSRGINDRGVEVRVGGRVKGKEKVPPPQLPRRSPSVTRPTYDGDQNQNSPKFDTHSF